MIDFGTVHRSFLSGGLGQVVTLPQRDVSSGTVGPPVVQHYMNTPLLSEKETAYNIFTSTTLKIKQPGPDSGPGLAIPGQYARQRYSALEGFFWEGGGVAN